MMMINDYDVCGDVDNDDDDDDGDADDDDDDNDDVEEDDDDDAEDCVLPLPHSSYIHSRDAEKITHDSKNLLLYSAISQ